MTSTERTMRALAVALLAFAGLGHGAVPAWAQEARGAGDPPAAAAQPAPEPEPEPGSSDAEGAPTTTEPALNEVSPGIPVPGQPVSNVPPDTLRRLSMEADLVWRLAILASGRSRDPAVLRLGHRVALTQADLGRHVNRLARMLDIEMPAAPTAETAARIDALRRAPADAAATALTAEVRRSYPDMVGEIAGWTDGSERAVADALLPALRQDLEDVERLGGAPLTGSSGAAPAVTASPR